MNKLQFSVLLRQFLFRLFDMEVLSQKAEGDASKLFGQLAALLIYVSAVVGFAGLMFYGPAAYSLGLLRFVVDMIVQHFLIATTMLVVGLFAVLSWDGIFPDRRDSQVLGPLPVTPGTMFAAKVSAVAAALGLTILLLHSLTGLLWPLLFATGIFGVLRSFAAYWLTMLLAGAFAYGAVLTTQGLAALLLPRRLFLRFSGYLQLAAVCVILAAYFLQPGFYSISELLGSHRLIPLLPSYWFLALYQQLNGSMYPVLQPLARRAWIGLAAVLCGTPAVYALSYWRMLSAIAEEPDITPAPPRWGFAGKGPLLGLGSSARYAITQFSARTLARSRQHRLILSFYLGTGLAYTTLILKGAGSIMNTASYSGREESMLLWDASFLVMSLAIVGTRVAFAIPFELKANWLFQVAGVRSGPNNLAAVRRALYTIAVVPVWLLTAGICLTLWRSWENAGHLGVLALTGVILVDICLIRFPKIPFTCSWLPGKSRMNMAFLAALGLRLIGSDAASFERQTLQDMRSTLWMLAVLVFTAICLRTAVLTLANREKEPLRFEEEPVPVVMGLQLDHD